MEIRPLISKNKRIMISNAHPWIPHTDIENVLKTYDITPVSRVSFLKASLGDDDYSHAYSFRRQVYIKPEDECKLPVSVHIKRDGTSHWIYFSGDSLKCFLCKEEGHMAKHCKQVINSTSPHSEPTKVTESEETQDDANMETQQLELIPKEAQTPQESAVNKIPNKRPLSDPSKLSTSVTDGPSESVSLQENFKAPTSPKPKIKKVKTTLVSKVSVSNELEPLESIINSNSKEYKFDYTKLKAFIESTYGSRNVTHLAKKITDNNIVLASNLRNLYPHLSSRGMKNRFTKIIKSLDPNRMSDKTSKADSSTSELSTNEEDVELN